MRYSREINASETGVANKKRISGFSRASLLLLLAVVIVIAAFMMKGRGKSAKSGADSGSSSILAKELPPTPVTLGEVTTGTVKNQFEVSGDIAALTEVSLAAKITARILSVTAREGDRVSKGQLLVQLDASDLESQVRSAQDSLVASQAKLHQSKVALRLQVKTSQIAIDTAKEQLKSAEAGRDVMKEGSRTQEKLVAQSAVNSAQANLDNAQTNYNRIARLFKEGAIAQSEVDTADTQLKVAKANLSSAQQQLSLKEEGNRPQEIVQAETQVATAQQNLTQAYDNQRQIALKQADVDAASATVKQAKTAVTLAMQTRDYANIRSSVDGVVSHRMAEQGQMATTGSPLLKITVPGTVYFSASVSETNMAETHAGQSVVVRVDSYPDETFVGKIDRIYPTGDTSSRTFIARITLSDAGGKLKPGMFARGEILVAQRSGVTLVPKTAITTAGGSVSISDGSLDAGVPSSVFVIGDGRTVLKKIKVGVPTDDDVEVISGLKPGDKVVISGSRLEEGQKVNVTH